MDGFQNFSSPCVKELTSLFFFVFLTSIASNSLFWPSQLKKYFSGKKKKKPSEFNLVSNLWLMESFLYLIPLHDYPLLSKLFKTIYFVDF